MRTDRRENVNAYSYLSAVYDGWYYLNIHVKGMTDNNILSQMDQQIIETDAYFHHLYEPYPELFKFLVPNIVNFHKEEVEDEEYQSCLRLGPP